MAINGQSGRGGSGGRDNYGGGYRSGRGGYGGFGRQQGPMRHESRNSRQQQQRRLPDNVDPNHPVVVQFKMFADLIDDKNDRHERIVKLSRDITADSKKVIFLLHRISRDDQKPAILQEAEQKLFDIRQRLFKSVAKELRGQDAFKYRRAYTAGMQEYIEARSFYHFIFYDTLVSYEEIEKELQFKVWNRKKTTTDTVPVRIARLLRDDEKTDESDSDESDIVKKPSEKEGDETSEKEEKKPSKKEGEETSEKEEKKPSEGDKTSEEARNTADASEKTPPDTSEDDKTADTTAETEPEKSGGDDDNNTFGGDKETDAVVHSPEDIREAKKPRQEEKSSEDEYEYELVQMPVPYEDYVLGIADLTGEVMRQAINATGRSDWETVFTLLGFLHEINNGFLEAQAATPSGYGSGKEIFYKVKTLKASLRKVEQACFTITVRGSELPKSALTSELFAAADEGSEDWDSSVCSY